MSRIEHERRGRRQVLERITTGQVVAATNLVGTNTNLGRQQIHRSLDGVAGLRPARSSVGVGRSEVGEIAVTGKPERRDVVNPGVQETPEQRHAGREQHHVGAHVGVDVNPHPGELALGVGCQLDLLELAPTLVGGERRFGSGLGPAHRTAQLADQRHGQKFVGVDVELGSETASHRGSNDTELILRNAGGGGDHHLQDVGHLGGGIERDVSTHRRWHRQYTSGLDCHRDQPLLDELGAHGVGGRVERRFQRIGIRNEGPVVGLVGFKVAVG